MRKRESHGEGISRKRIMIIFVAVIALFAAIVCRLGYIQIIKADEYSEKALSQQTTDVVVTAKRGNIYDSSNQPLAINKAGYSVWVRPADIQAKDEKEEKKGNPGYIENMTKILEKLFAEQETKDGIKTEDGEGDEDSKDSEDSEDSKNSKDSESDKDDADSDEEDSDKEYEKIYGYLTSDSKSIVKVCSFVDDEIKKKIEKYVEKGTITGIQIENTTTRYYPMGTFASKVIGFTNNANTGASGLELYFDRYLNGTNGRSIYSKDNSGRSLSNGVERYYAAEDGCNIVTTIDEVIQQSAEDAVETVTKNTDAEKAIAIVMDPKTGYVLAMAEYPTYDPNDPYEPTEEYDLEAYEELETEEKTTFLNKMWRNSCVNDVYEPGSPFKLITTGIALDEGKTSMDDTFVCNGIVQVADAQLKCHAYPNSHGTETLMVGVENSCNPVFIELSHRIGIDKFYEKLELFGFMNLTGIECPGEAESIIQSKSSAGIVGLSTMSYGQGIACTPIQLITALSSFGNGGKMMQPRLVKSLTDDEGNVLESYEPEVVAQVVSEETASDICTMMEGVVKEGTGKAVYIPGYRIGGKTGTAQKAGDDGKYTEYTYSSFFAMAPMDNPQVAVLVVVDSPKGAHSGSATAGPGVKMIMSDVLPYLKVKPSTSTSSDETESTTSEEKEDVTVPDLTGLTYSAAKSKLEKLGLSAVNCASDEDYKVADQYPKSGNTVKEGKSVCLYDD